MTKYSNKIGNIPDDWDFINANDCLIIESGMRPKEYVTDIDTHIPSLGGENIDDSGCLVFDNIRYIDPSYYKKMKKGHIKDDDIYINKDGANTGKVAFSKTKPFKECAVNEHVFLIRNDGTFKQQYLFYCLLSNLGKQQILKKIIGSAQEGINNSFTKGIILPKPSLPEQASIANILSKVDEAIESVKKSIAAAEKLKKSLMQNLLTGRMKPDGTLRTEEEFYEDEKFGKVPIVWEVNRFKEFAVLQRGNDLTDNDVVQGDYPVVKSNGVSIYHNKYFVEPPGVVTGRSGTIGKAFYIEERFWAHNTTLYVKDFKGNVPKYIYYLILSMDFSRYYAGTTVPTLNRNDIHKLKVIIPKVVEEQQKIVSVLDASNVIINDKQNKITALERLKKSLMQNLLTGKVRVGEGKVNPK